MCAQISKRNGSHHHIISALNDCRTQSNNIVSYDGFKYAWYSSAFKTLVIFVDGIPENVKDGLVSSALQKPTPNGKVTLHQLETALSNEEKNYKNLRVKTYYVKAELSMRGSIPFKQLTLGGVTFLFNSNLKTKPIDAYTLSNPPFYGNLPKNYKKVFIRIDAKTPLDAGHTAIHKLDMLRGFWNLLLNDSFRISYGQRKPISKITSGPFYSVHTKGRLIERALLHETTFVVGAKIIDITTQSSNLKANTVKLQRTIRTSSFNTLIADALARYARALDTIDYEHSIIELWSILESLTHTSKYDELISRVGSIYINQEDALAVIDHLRLRRNEIVHRSPWYRDSESVVFQLKAFVEALIQNYIGTLSREFSSKKELITFLDMPRDAKMLKIGQRYIK